MNKVLPTLSHRPVLLGRSFAQHLAFSIAGLCVTGFGCAAWAQGATSAGEGGSPSWLRSPLLFSGDGLPRETAAIEFLAGAGSLSDGYGNAQNYTLRGMGETSFGTLQGELSRQSRFGFNGTYASLALMQDWGADYRTMFSLGAGDSALFPSYRVDAAVYAKLGPQKQYALGVGGYYADGNEAGRSDTGLLLNGIYYGDPLTLEAGLRVNRAEPGAAVGSSQFVAATFGNPDRRALVLRAERSNETWQVLTTGPAKVDFISHTVGAQWRERITRDGLLILGVGYYQSPNYNRSSIEVGWRWSFR